MKIERYGSIVEKYPKLRIAVVGDFCLDRYLEIDPGLKEDSIETKLPVYNITRVRAQPGGAGTILNNLVALGMGTIYPVAFCGEDGEGYELRQALSNLVRVKLDYFFATPARKTFTYCKPLIVEKGKSPRELNRLDTKNWSPTPAEVETRLITAIRKLTKEVDAIAVLDQVDLKETGVVTSRVLEALYAATKERPELVVIADSRSSLKSFPAFSFKMNRDELVALSGTGEALDLDAVRVKAVGMARQNQRQVFVTLSEQGILGASPDGSAVHVPCLPIRGEIDIVGAGDAVTANLCAAIAAGAGLGESIEMANAAASIVVHQLGTTGTANVEQIKGLLS